MSSAQNVGREELRSSTGFENVLRANYDHATTPTTPIQQMSMNAANPWQNLHLPSPGNYMVQQIPTTPNTPTVLDTPSTAASRQSTISMHGSNLWSPVASTNPEGIQQELRNNNNDSSGSLHTPVIPPFQQIVSPNCGIRNPFLAFSHSHFGNTTTIPQSNDSFLKSAY